MQPHGLQPTRPPRPWESPGKNTGVGGHALLQGIFTAQGSNPRLLCWFFTTSAWEAGIPTTLYASLAAQMVRRLPAMPETWILVTSSTEAQVLAPTD